MIPVVAALVVLGITPCLAWTACGGSAVVEMGQAQSGGATTTDSEAGSSAGGERRDLCPPEFLPCPESVPGAEGACACTLPQHGDVNNCLSWRVPSGSSTCKLATEFSNSCDPTFVTHGAPPGFAAPYEFVVSRDCGPGMQAQWGFLYFKLEHLVGELAFFAHTANSEAELQDVHPGLSAGEIVGYDTDKRFSCNCIQLSATEESCVFDIYGDQGAEFASKRYIKIRVLPAEGATFALKSVWLSSSCVATQ